MRTGMWAMDPIGAGLVFALGPTAGATAVLVAIIGVSTLAEDFSGA
jgi:hypothetical protein